jgi:hypothetical protein
MEVRMHIQEVMKRALPVVLLIGALAIPLVAEEPKKQQQEPAPAQQPAPAAPAAVQQAQPDSPMVAAAKRSKRLGRKPVAPVITNATLKHSAGGSAHITTTSTPQGLAMPPVLPAPHPTPEMEAAAARAALEKARAAEAVKQKAATEGQRQKAEQAAAAVEEGYDGASDDASEFAGSAPPPPF